MEEESEESQNEISEFEEVSDECKKEISGSEEFEELEITERVSKCKSFEESEEKKKDVEFEDQQIQAKCEIKLRDTLKCKDLLNKFVKVVTADNICCFGLLKYLDSMSGDMIIVNARGDRPDIVEKTLIFQETCVSVTLHDENKTEHGDQKVLPILTTKKRKDYLVSWFKDHQLPIQENKDGSLLVFNIARINAPYEPHDCFCDNPSVLMQTKTIVQNIQLEEHSIEAQLQSAASEIVTHKN